MHSGTHTVAGLGSCPYQRNRSASGIQESTMLRPLTIMVSMGKHSRGNWVFESNALLLSSEFPPWPREVAKKVQDRMPTKR